jgi:hypothetical protein
MDFCLSLFFSCLNLLFSTHEHAFPRTESYPRMISLFICGYIITIPARTQGGNFGILAPWQKMTTTSPSRDANA